MENFENPASTVDMIVPYDKGIVLIRRKHPPFQGCWALPGGYLECGKETLEEAAIRELREETSLIAEVSDLNLIGVYSSPTRDPRGHVISHVYEVERVKGELKAMDDAAEIEVFKELPVNLAFDHRKIIENYMKGRFVKWKI